MCIWGIPTCKGVVQDLRRLLSPLSASVLGPTAEHRYDEAAIRLREVIAELVLEQKVRFDSLSLVPIHHLPSCTSHAKATRLSSRSAAKASSRWTIAYLRTHTLLRGWSFCPQFLVVLVAKDVHTRTKLTTGQVSLLTGADSWRTVALPGVPSIKTTDGPSGARGEHFTNGTRVCSFLSLC